MTSPSRKPSQLVQVIVEVGGVAEHPERTGQNQLVLAVTVDQQPNAEHSAATSVPRYRPSPSRDSDFRLPFPAALAAAFASFRVCFASLLAFLHAFRQILN